MLFYSLIVAAAAIVVQTAGMTSAFLFSTSTAPSTGRHPPLMLSMVMTNKRYTTSDELIPREILFGNPENTSPLLSPDGNHLAFLAPSPNGVMNIFIRSNLSSLFDDDSGKDNSTAAAEVDRMITNEPKRAIRSLAWVYDSSTILYMQDNDGDENFHLFAVTVDNDIDDDDEISSIPKARDLTPGKNVKAQNIFTNYRYPNEILVGTNQRNPKVRNGHSL